jgi:energy-coupling factor transport system permease protein
MIYELYVPARGWLQRLDPRTKLLLVPAGILLFIATGDVLSLLLLVALLHLTLRSSKIPWRRILWVASQLRFVLLVILLLFPWIAAEPGQVLLRAGPLTVTDQSILRALEIAARLGGSALLAMSLLFTTTQTELVRGMVALGVPFQWGLTLALALRYIPSFAQQVQHIQEAQASRGWTAARGNLPRRLRNLFPLFLALTIHVFRTADTLTMALTARGAGRPGPRTVRQPLRMMRKDWTVLLVALAGAMAWILRNVSWRNVF